jgi:pantoate--beta-alanine ligase
MRAIITAEPLARLDYISAADPITLAELAEIGEGAVLSTAVFFSRTRLIDNMIWQLAIDD